MVFNNLFTPKNKKTAPELFLAVEIHESMIKSAVWQVEDEKPSIVALGSYELWDSENSLINGIDASLTEAIRGLAGKPDRVVLGLPDSWLAQNRIHPTKQKLIKRLISELDLKAIGMVTITEAIVSHLKTQEGVPPTAILLEIYPSKVIVSLVNLGEIQAQEEVGRSDDLARDVEEGLARFEAEKLPARFILTNGSDLENEEQQIIGYSWTEKLPFIHLPKVQVLPIDFSIRAIALSGGSEAAKSLGLEIVTEDTARTKAEKSDSVVESIETDLTSLGFAIDGEATEITQVTETETFTEPETDLESEVEEPKPKTFALPKFNFPRFSFPKVRLGILGIILPLVFLIALVGGIGAYYFLFGKVKVAMSLAPVRVSQTIDVSIGTGTKDNFLSVIATKKTLSAKASDTISTTGEATVGDKATGKVVISNLCAQAVSLKAGTKLTSNNGLVFILDSESTISTSSGVIPCSITSSVTASKIGAEFNLEKNAPLTVENYQKSVLTARVETGLSGGSSRTVKAVSKADQDKLLSQVSDKIKASIDDQLKATDPDNRSIIIGQPKYTTKTFDRSFGQEATSLSLDLAADVDILVYSKKQMLSQIEKKILTSADPGLILDSSQTQVSFTNPTPIDANTFATKANVQTALFPKINEAQITSAVKGKSVSSIKTILQTVPGYQSALVMISPNIPLLNQFLPTRGTNYSYSISSH